jgi:hypothetical protein
MVICDKDKMQNTHPIIILSLIAIGAVVVAQISFLASAPNVPAPAVPAAEAPPVPEPFGKGATPNQPPASVGLKQPAAVAIATPNQAPIAVGSMRPSAEETVALRNRPRPVFSTPSPAVASVATPHPVSVAAAPALDPVMLRAEPEPAATQTAAPKSAATAEAKSAAPKPAATAEAKSAAPKPAATAEAKSAAPQPAAPIVANFVVTRKTLLYARDNARLRAGPSTSSEVLAKLIANSPLSAVARSSDGAWWQVELGGGRIGYIHRAAVTNERIETAELPTMAMPAAVTPPAQPAPASRRPGLLGYVDETVDWFNDTAATGTAPKTIRPER